MTKHFYLIFVGLLGFCLMLSTQAFSQGVSPDIVVALDGTGDFTKIQDAIDAVPDNSSIPTIIYIKRGLYDTEKLIVPANKQNVYLIGESRSQTIISYHIYDCQSGGFNGKCPASDAMQWSGANLQTSATLTILGDGFQAENLTIENTAGPVGQAQAITVRSDKVVFRNCDLKGYQDTIYFWSVGKRTYMENCLVIGRTDYIYGGGIAFFEKCEIRSWGGGWITAPSTEQNQPYGFVFDSCAITYDLNSPRAGDDGTSVALGRPWQNYPKVAWLYCDMTEKINPLGWPDKWNMPYADTSADLHLYEYMNTGIGADMGGRANWVGIRALMPSEAPYYSVDSVLGGSDGWNPAAQAALIPTYNWTGNGATPNWRLADNWNPVAIPDTNEAAYVIGADTIEANGGHFVADLSISDSAMLFVTASSEVTYLSVSKAQILAAGNVSLDGVLRTKDSLEISSTDTFGLNTEILGVHRIEKTGAGVVGLNHDNSNFSGNWFVSEGSLAANVSNSLGKARSVTIDSTGALTIEQSDAMNTNTALRVFDGAQLNLNASLNLLEFYIDGAIQPVGTYSSTTNPNLINGSGTITVGRPTSYTFVGGGNGNWDVAAHFQPALLPEAGDTVYNGIEMETTSFIFPADVYVEAGGRIRLRGTHSASGTLYMENGSSFSYATSGSGFTLNANTVIEGEVLCQMNSRNTPSHSMRLGGDIRGGGRVIAFNSRSDAVNTGILVLAGDNSGFRGVWDITRASGATGSVAAMQGSSENAFGHGLIQVTDSNFVALNHNKCAGDTLRVELGPDSRIRMDQDAYVYVAMINDSSLAPGEYTALTHPGWLTGDSKLYVGRNVYVETQAQPKVFVNENILYIEGQKSLVSLYDLSGRKVINPSPAKAIPLKGLLPGVYVVKYELDGIQGVKKILLR